MSDNTPTLSDLLSAAIDARLDRVYTARPGRIVSFDARVGTASVQASTATQVLNENGDLELVEFPVLPNVPVIFPGGGMGNEITFIPEKGTSGLIVCCDSPIDAWKGASGNKPVNPGAPRRHWLGDAVFIPGLVSPFAAKLAVNRFVAGAMVLHAKSLMLLGGTTSTSPVARKTDLDAIKGALKDTSIVTAMAAVASAPPGPAQDAAKIALDLAVDLYFSTHPADGSSKVESQ